MNKDQDLDYLLKTRLTDRGVTTAVTIIKVLCDAATIPEGKTSAELLKECFDEMIEKKNNFNYNMDRLIAGVRELLSAGATTKSGTK